MADNLEFRWALDVIRQFRARHRSRPRGAGRLTDKALAEAFDIDRRQFARRLESGAGKQDRLQQQFILMAKAIRDDESAVVERALGSGAARAVPADSDAQEALRQAMLFAGTEEIAASVVLARRALGLACAQGTDAASQVLPSALYLLMRHAHPKQLLHSVRHDILPMLRQQPRRRLPVAEAAAAIAQLACALNESGRHGDALNLFDRRAVRQLAAAEGRLAWCGPMLLRNEAHAWVWDNHSVQRAMDCADGAAARASTDSNAQSVANTKCEILLHAAKFAEAWEAVEPFYHSIRSPLLTRLDESTGDFVRPVPLRFQSSFGSLLIAVFARLGMRDASYRAAQQEEDVLLIEAMLQIDDRGFLGRPMLHGGIATLPKIQIPDRICNRLMRLYSATIKPRLDSRDVAGISDCEAALRDAAGI